MEYLQFLDKILEIFNILNIIDDQIPINLVFVAVFLKSGNMGETRW